MSEGQVGVVVKFFAKPSVAAIKVTKDTIKKGEQLKFKGSTTDFMQTVASLEINNQPVEEAGEGEMVGIKVTERVRENDKIYKVVE